MFEFTKDRRLVSDAKVSSIILPNKDPKLDLILTVRVALDGRTNLDIEYDKRAMAEIDVRSLAKYFIKVAGDLAVNHKKPLGMYELISSTEKQDIISIGSGPKKPLGTKTYWGLFV